VGDLNITPLVNTREKSSYAFAKNAIGVGKVNELFAKTIYGEAKQARFCLSLGGDHSMAIGSVSGILKARPETRVIWVDAHADINTPELSKSHNIHGMAVAFLMRLIDPKQVPGFSWMADWPKLATNRIVYIGLRDVDPAEKEILHTLGIKAFSMQQIDKYGIGKVVEMSFDHLASSAEDKQLPPLHLSVDIDSCDPFLAPSTGTKVRGGLSFREANYICEAAAETDCVGSMEMVEVNPMLGDHGNPLHDETVDTALDMITSVLGNRILRR